MGFERIVQGGQGRAHRAGQQGGAVGFKVNSLIGDDKIIFRHALADEADQMRVPGDAPDQQNFFAGYFCFFNEIDDLGCHDIAQRKHDVARAGLPLVQTVGTVAFHEDRTAGGQFQNPAFFRNGMNIVETVSYTHLTLPTIYSV